MLQHNPLPHLPTALDLPDSDDTPVDNELQIPVTTLLRAILAWLWADRQDWFFGVNMGFYYQPPNLVVVPDGFLSLGVVRRVSERGRLSYVLWEENYVVPLLVVEVVSRTYGQEYDDKQTLYAQINVLYYVVYNPDFWQRDKHEPFEVYRLVEGRYVRQLSERVWMPEIGLGISRARGVYEGWEREWLFWYDQAGNRLPSPEERAAQELKQERQRVEQERQRAEQEQRLREELLNKLRQRGINPDEL